MTMSSLIQKSATITYLKKTHSDEISPLKNKSAVLLAAAAVIIPLVLGILAIPLVILHPPVFIVPLAFFVTAGAVACAILSDTVAQHPDFVQEVLKNLKKDMQSLKESITNHSHDENIDLSEGTPLATGYKEISTEQSFFEKIIRLINA